MKLPAIDITALPGLDTAVGMFGSLVAQTKSVDDRIVVLMVYVYETVPPPPPGII